MTVLFFTAALLCHTVQVVGGIKYPYLASIGTLGGDGEWVHHCGGAIIDRAAVLTLASCASSVPG